MTDNGYPSIEEVLNLKLEDIIRRPAEYFQRQITADEITHILRLTDALWLHSGDPNQPHAELTSGKCSNGFVDVLRALRFTNLCRLFGMQLARKIFETYTGPIDWVVGSDHAGATISFAAALSLEAQHDFTEKGLEKKQLWRRFQIQPDQVVLQVEELITTTGTLQAVRQGIIAAHAWPIKFAPLTATVVHRSSVFEYHDHPIVHLVHYDIQTWEPADCPLCAQGSRRLRPKEHWAELTA